MLKVSNLQHLAHNNISLRRIDQIIKFTWCLVFQSLMVAKAKEELEQEIVEKDEQKAKYLEEKAPPIQTGGLSLAELRVPFNIHYHFVATHRLKLRVVTEITLSRTQLFISGHYGEMI